MPLGNLLVRFTYEDRQAELQLGLLFQNWPSNPGWPVELDAAPLLRPPIHFTIQVVESLGDLPRGQLIEVPKRDGQALLRIQRLQSAQQVVAALARDQLPLLGTAQELGQRPKKVSKRAVAELMEYNWPGNIRELENLIERLVILTQSQTIDVEDLPLLGPAKNLDEQFLEKETYNEFRESVEKEFFVRKLRTYGFNVSKTARKLGMQRSNLYKKLEKYGIPYKRSRDDEDDRETSA